MSVGLSMSRRIACSLLTLSLSSMSSVSSLRLCRLDVVYLVCRQCCLVVNAVLSSMLSSRMSQCCHCRHSRLITNAITTSSRHTHAAPSLGSLMEPTMDSLPLLNSRPSTPRMTMPNAEITVQNQAFPGCVSVGPLCRLCRLCCSYSLPRLPSL